MHLATEALGAVSGDVQHRLSVPRGGSLRGSPQACLPVTRGPIHDRATTHALVRNARTAEMVLRWCQGFAHSKAKNPETDSIIDKDPGRTWSLQ